MIQGIFFAVFLPQKGTQVVYQSPACSITPEIGVEKACMLEFEAIAEFVIPRQVFCNRYITVCDPNNKYRILGHPVCIQNQKYVRNEFIFNFCIVIKTDTDPLPYETVVRRLAGTFTEMEIQNQFLSEEVKEESLPNSRGRHSITALLEIIKEDLNNYHECMIPADDANTINMKLFPVRRPPPPVKSWHVPVLKIHLSKYMDDTWDLTLVKVINFIDGIRDVRRISFDADVCIFLAKVALQHLLYYDAILLLDIFFFSNIYAPNPYIRGFITNEDQMQEECSNYVCINGPMVDNFYLSRLYTSLAPGRTLIAWLKLHRDDGLEVLDHIDVRRFIQFGIIKGFLYRIHNYALSSKIGISPATKDTVSDASKSDALEKYADGCHCFDQIIVEKNLSQAQILEQLLAIPNVDIEIIYR